MEREIKFRGKSIFYNEWVYGNLIISGDEFCIAGYDIYRKGESPWFWEEEEVPSDTIGQFTGLKDKNGKEIYEGDIVEWLFFYTIHSSNGADGDREELLKGVIEWRQGGFVFGVLENDFENAGWYSISDLHTETQTDVEVIGNIYDNPELLTEK